MKATRKRKASTGNEVPIATVVNAVAVSIDDDISELDNVSSGVVQPKKPEPRKPNGKGSITSALGIESKLNASESSNRTSTLASLRLHDGIRPWPKPFVTKVINSFSRPLNVERADPLFKKHQWPTGLRETIFKSCRKIPLRFFIVDDSGLCLIPLQYMFNRQSNGACTNL
jgi:hypothetical protein